ncbi:MAG: RecQ family ATP-dependent DNA helicase [Flavobacteriales bacterium Tduv]
MVSSYYTTPLDILKKYWGYEQFLSPQEEIIQSVLNGEDLLVLLPTGGGKSICFQAAALMQEGICLVISPLIALMRDQVRNLLQKRIPSDYISSERSEKEINIILDNATYGKTRLLYISPERLQNRKFLERVKHLKINLMAIDEAHCISQWGYDFRPSYLKIIYLRKIFPQTPFLALTASATPKTVNDIMEKLAFKTKKIIRKSFLRENISYKVLHSDNKWSDLKLYLLKYQGTTIIYVRSRKKTKEISEHLNMNGFQSDYYHAGLTSEEKKKRKRTGYKNTPLSS